MPREVVIVTAAGTEVVRRLLKKTRPCVGPRCLSLRVHEIEPLLISTYAGHCFGIHLEMRYCKSIRFNKYVVPARGRSACYVIVFKFLGVKHAAACSLITVLSPHTMTTKVSPKLDENA